MSEQLQQTAPVEQVGNSTEIQWGDAPTQEATQAPAVDTTAAEPAVPVAAPETQPAEPAPPPDSPTQPEPVRDFTLTTLENGQHEVRLATGQVYRGATLEEAVGKVAQAQVEASRTIQQLRAPQQQQETVQPQQPTQQPAPAQIDPSIMAVVDYIAPAFGLKNGQEMVERFGALGAMQAGYGELQQARQSEQAATSFLRATPDFVATEGNIHKLGELMDKMSLAPTPENFAFAHYALKGQGVYEAAPVHPSATQPRTTQGQFAPRTNQMPLPPTSSAPSPASSAPNPWAMSDEEFLAQYA